MTTANERLREIGKTITDAMEKVDVDFSRESPAISESQAGLDETVTLYCENKASKQEVKSAYRTFVKAHEGGMF